MLSAQLHRHGAAHVIVDKKPGITHQSKALAVQARTMEFYQQLGLTDEAQQRGFVAKAVSVFVNGRQRVGLDLQSMGGDLSPFPYIFILEQSHNEDILSKHLKACDGGVRWQHECTSIERVADGFVGELASPNGTIPFRCRYLVGCGGARSPVRKFSSANFPGETASQLFFVADLRLEADFPQSSVVLAINDDQFMAFFPMSGDGHVRALGVLPDTVEDPDNFPFELLQQHIEQNLGLPARIASHSWYSSYRVHHRVVDSFADNGLFLAGDAAHLHSPAGGQGMNTGLGDAVNLGWKLAAAVNDGNTSLLPSYDIERRPFAERLVATTDRMFNLMVSKSVLPVAMRTKVMPKFMGMISSAPTLQQMVFKVVSQMFINYRGSPISQRQTSGNYESGDRFPWFSWEGGHAFEWFRQPGYCVITSHDRAQNVAVPKTMRSVEPCAAARDAMRTVGLGDGPIVVRPDMHIA